MATSWCQFLSPRILPRWTQDEFSHVSTSRCIAQIVGGPRASIPRHYWRKWDEQRMGSPKAKMGGAIPQPQCRTYGKSAKIGHDWRSRTPHLRDHRSLMTPNSLALRPICWRHWKTWRTTIAEKPCRRGLETCTRCHRQGRGKNQVTFAPDHTDGVYPKPGYMKIRRERNGPWLPASITAPPPLDPLTGKSWTGERHTVFTRPRLPGSPPMWRTCGGSANP